MFIELYQVFIISVQMFNAKEHDAMMPWCLPYE